MNSKIARFLRSIAKEEKRPKKEIYFNWLAIDWVDRTKLRKRWFKQIDKRMKTKVFNEDLSDFYAKKV